MYWEAGTPFLIERRQRVGGATFVMQGRVTREPWVNVVRHSAQPYMEMETPVLWAEFAAKKINIAGVFASRADDRIWPQRGYHVFVEGFDFVDLEEMRQFFSGSSAPISFEVWPDGSEAIQAEMAVQPKPWELPVPEGWELE